MLDYSWQLLAHDEQVLLARLSVFTGDFSLHFAKAVTGAHAPQLHRLWNKSLLRHAGTGRYSVHPLIRQFAWQKLQALGDLAHETRRRHCHIYLQFIIERQADLTRAKEEALAAIDLEIANISTAWSWALEAETESWLPDAFDAIQLYHIKRYLYSEGLADCLHVVGALDKIESLGEAAPLPPAPSTLPALRCLGEIWQAAFLQHLGDYSTAQIVLEQCETTCKVIEPYASRLKAFRLYQMGNLYFVSNLERALECYTESYALYRELGNEWYMALLLQQQANVNAGFGNYKHAFELANDSYRRLQALGSRRALAQALATLADIAMDQQSFEASHRYARQAIELCRTINEPAGLAIALGRLSSCYLRFGHLPDAIPLLNEAVALLKTLGLPSETAYWQTRLGIILSQLGNYAAVLELVDQIEASGNDLTNKRVSAWCLQLRGMVALAQSEYAVAHSLLEKALVQFEARHNIGACHLCRAYLAVGEVNLDRMETARNRLEPLAVHALNTRGYMLIQMVLVGLAVYAQAMHSKCEENSTEAPAILETCAPLLERAARLAALAQAQPWVARSQWFQDIGIRRINQATQKLPQTTRQAINRWVSGTEFWTATAEIIDG